MRGQGWTISLKSYLRHVHIINKVNEFFRSWWPEISSSFFLERFFHNTLQHHWSCVKVKWNIGYNIVIIQWIKFRLKSVFNLVLRSHSRLRNSTANENLRTILKTILNEYSFTRTSISNEHNRFPLIHQHVHEESNSCCFWCWNHCCLEGLVWIVIEAVRGRHFGPWEELFRFGVNIIVENSALRWEFYRFELSYPPFWKFNTMICQLILE